MNPIDLRRVDLNLLKAFDALERLRSVTRAAEALSLGQPAMSHALARLRELTQDELFVRGPSGMAPTPRALELIGPIRSALAQIEVALYGPTEFNIKDADQTFRLGMTDFVAAAVIPKLTRCLGKRAPKVTLSVLNSDRTNAAKMLDDRQIDVAVGLFPETAAWHVTEALFEETHSCVFNPKRVRADSPITLAQFVSEPHVLVTLDGDRTGFIDEIVAELGMERTVLVSIPYFLLAGYLLHQLPLIATLPTHYAQLCAMTSKLVISPLPFKTPSFTVSMMWHRRENNLPSFNFLLVNLRDALAATAGS